MSEVVPIRHGVSPAPALGEVNQEVVNELQRLLDRANSGEITGFAYASLHPGDTTFYSNVGRLTRGVLGALTLLQFSLAKSDHEQ